MLNLDEFNQPKVYISISIQSAWFYANLVIVKLLNRSQVRYGLAVPCSADSDCVGVSLAGEVSLHS